MSGSGVQGYDDDDEGDDDDTPRRSLNVAQSAAEIARMAKRMADVTSLSQVDMCQEKVYMVMELCQVRPIQNLLPGSARQNVLLLASAGWRAV